MGSEQLRELSARADARARRDALLAVAAVAIAVVPFVVALLNISRSVHLQGDFAVFDLRVRDVLAARPPLVGAYSRFRWNHPGPLFSYATAGLSQFFGRAEYATVAGAITIRATAFALIGRIAWKHGRLPMVLGALLAVLLPYGALGEFTMVEPWNPYVTVPFFVLFVLEVWAVAEGAASELIAVGIVGSFLVQTHVEYASFVIPAVAIVAIAWIPRWRAGAAAGMVRALTWTFGIVFVLWIPPLVDELAGSHNLGRLASFLTTDHGATKVGLGGAIELVGSGLASVPRWITYARTGKSDVLRLPIAVPTSPGTVALMAALFACGVVAVCVTKSRSDAWLISTVAAFGVTGVFTIMRADPPIYDYLTSWRLWIAALLLLAVGRAMVRALPFARPGSVVRCVIVGSLALALVLGVVSAGWRVALTGQVSRQPETATVLARQLAHDAPRGPVLLRKASPSFLGIYEGLVDELDRRGVDVRVPRHLGYKFGDERVGSARSSTATWFLAVSTWDLPELLARTNGHVVAKSTPLNAARERELEALQSSVIEELASRLQTNLIIDVDSPTIAHDVAGATGQFARDLERLSRLNHEVDAAPFRRCVVFEIDEQPAIHPST